MLIYNLKIFQILNIFRNTIFYRLILRMQCFCEKFIKEYFEIPYLYEFMKFFSNY
jgi:hypothetical protein